MTENEYREKINDIISSYTSGLILKNDAYEQIYSLLDQMWKEEWYQERIINAWSEYIDGFVDIKDVAIGDKNFFVEKDKGEINGNL